MSATNYTPIYLYNSGTATNTPLAANLGAGELAINYADGKLFYKDGSAAVQVIGWKTTPTTAGGTGLTSYTAGDLPYYASGSALSKLGIGTANYVLTSSGTAPQYVAQSTLTVGNATNAVNVGTTDNTSSSSTYYPTLVSATSGNNPITTSSTKLSFVPSTGKLTATSYGGAWAGSTIGTGYGGTGLTSFTANGVVYASSTSALATGSGLLFDGANLGIGVTPSAWVSGRPALEISVKGNAIWSYANEMRMLENLSYNGTNWVTPSTGGYAVYEQSGGAHLWYLAANSTAGGTVTPTATMTLNSSSYLLVGTTTSTGSYQIETSGTLKAATGLVTGSGGGVGIGADNTNNTFYTSSLGSGSTTMYIGNKSITAVSDVRIKNNIKPTEINAVQVLNQWQIIDHTWNDPSDTAPVNRNTRGTWVGVTAQQIIDSTPWLVNAPDKNCSKCKSGEHCEEHTSLWQVDFEYSVPLLVKAIQELSAQVTTLQAKVSV